MLNTRNMSTLEKAGILVSQGTFGSPKEPRVKISQKSKEELL
jgi:hypothetical protein